MQALRNLLLATCLLAAPLAAAAEPAGVETCTPVACVPRSCHPAAECSVDADPSTASCAVNATVDGRTCQTEVGARLASPEQGTRVGAEATLSQGHVNATNLPNAWATPALTVDAAALGVGLGRTSAGAYRSDILTEGHAWTETGVFVRHEGALAREGVFVSIWTLDGVPDGCVVRTRGGVEESPCPSLVPVTNLIPPAPTLP